MTLHSVPPPTQGSNVSKKEILKSFDQMLPCEMSDEQLKDRGSQLAHAQEELEAHLVSAKEHRAELRDEKKALELKVHDLAEAVRSKKESREVKCALRIGKRDGWVEVVRLDTQEVITTRKMSNVDAQADIPFEIQADAEALFKVPDETELEAG